MQWQETLPCYARQRELIGFYNCQVWQRGAAEEYDAWANDFGNGEEWGFKALLPYFKKSEQWLPPPPNVLPDQVITQSLASAHGRNGTLPVRSCTQSAETIPHIGWFAADWIQ